MYGPSAFPYSYRSWFSSNFAASCRCMCSRLFQLGHAKIVKAPQQQQQVSGRDTSTQIRVSCMTTKELERSKGCTLYLSGPRLRIHSCFVLLPSCGEYRQHTCKTRERGRATRRDFACCVSDMKRQVFVKTGKCGENPYCDQVIKMAMAR